jgi:hypothetical protein
MGLDRWSVSGTFKGKGEASGGDRTERVAVQPISVNNWKVSFISPYIWPYFPDTSILVV